MKVVINTKHGGFGLSRKAQELYFELTGYKFDNYSFHINRAEPALIQVVEQLDEEANGEYARLKVVEIPDEVEWEVKEYDGDEWIAELHRTWR